MIAPESLPFAYRALQRLIVSARARAYDGDADGAAHLLDGFELLPELLADELDRTEEVVLTLQGLAQAFPECRGIAEEFERAFAVRCEK